MNGVLVVYFHTNVAIQIIPLLLLLFTHFFIRFIAIKFLIKFSLEISCSYKGCKVKYSTLLVIRRSFILQLLYNPLFFLTRWKPSCSIIRTYSYIKLSSPPHAAHTVKSEDALAEDLRLTLPLNEHRTIEQLSTH